MNEIPKDNLEDLEKDLDKVCETREDVFTRLQLIEQKKNKLLDIYAKHTCPLEIGQVILNDFGGLHMGKNLKIIEIKGKEGQPIYGESKYSWFVRAKVLRKDGSESRLNITEFSEWNYLNKGR